VVDLKALWDFDDPASSEARFRAAASGTDDPERALLMTQVARAQGLQGRYDEGHATLDAIAGDGSAELNVRLALERGRLHNSAKQPAEALSAFHRAAELAAAPGLAGLRIDALHMVALASPAADRLTLTRAALAEARASDDPEARAWEASLLHNLGVELADTGALEEAHEVFVEALALREQKGQVAEARVGRWMVGWVLRLQGRRDEALAVQRALRSELAAAGEHDPYVDEELSLLEVDDAGRAG
jgi:tetratricopeptide (TPR) repeat protein